MSAVLCAAPGCEHPVPRRTGQAGRPPIYCSPGCRASRIRAALVVEADQRPEGEHGRDWEVRIRRGQQAVVVQRGLGRFSATLLTTELRTVLQGRVVGESS